MSKRRRARVRVTREDMLRAEQEREDSREEMRRLKETINDIPRMWQVLEDRWREFLSSTDYGKCLKVLGLVPPVTRDEIQTAYRTLAKVHHPDVGGNADEFKRIETAYRTALESADD